MRTPCTSTRKHRRSFTKRRKNGMEMGGRQNFPMARKSISPNPITQKTWRKAATEFLDAQGNRLQLRRDGKRDRQEIRTPHGHWIRFSYDESSRITRAEDDAGNWARYRYNPDGMLQDVLLSSGRERHYDYSGRLMTEITDEMGHVLLRNFYDYGFLIKQEFPNHESYSYNFQWSASNRYVEKATISPTNGRSEVIDVGKYLPNSARNP